ncbi:nucleotidyltransferase family protein [Thermosphaera chiliense]|uniref:Nucleotidyltransferase family protein n=1 Tax=Thermosphaera chiliense TaxID=3402707 RepID=A0A7M1UR81_9CREN|nr:nucleotidyltransferase family protein [Thermosphaera aggregans]QOR94768.1 nucleotidyltransferase family protein [Thermosphaera aggregans]
MLAAILAGGYGKRLRPFTNDVPKPMVQVGDKTLIEWQIEWLRRHGFNELVLLVGYKKEKMIEHVGSGSKYGVRVTYVIEDEPLGTGGAVKNAEHILSKTDVFLVVNGDILTDLDPKLLIEKLESANGLLGVIASIPLPSPYGVLEINGDMVTGFVEKPLLKDYWINAGVYALKPEALKYFPEKGDLEKTAFPAMARDGVLGTVKYTDVFWKAIDTFKELEEASKTLMERYRSG